MLNDLIEKLNTMAPKGDIYIYLLLRSESLFRTVQKTDALILEHSDTMWTITRDQRHGSDLNRCHLAGR